MTIWTLFLLALGLSMDAFAVSVTNSMCFAQFTRRQAAVSYTHLRAHETCWARGRSFAAG